MYFYLEKKCFPFLTTDKIVEHHKTEINSMTQNVDDFLELVKTEVAEIVKQQKSADKISTGWAVSFEEKFKSLQVLLLVTVVLMLICFHLQYLKVIL